MSKNNLDVVEYVLLDMIHRQGNVDDYALARQLRCPRTFLVSKLERLRREGYLTETPQGYQLLEKGETARIPLTVCDQPSGETQPEGAEELFDWTELYIPPVGWMD